MGVPVNFSYPQWLSEFPELVYINAGAAFTGSISGTALTVSAVTFGSLGPGQPLTDLTGAILPLTYVLGGSGTSWVVSNTQTVGSETMMTTGVVQAAFARACTLQDNTGAGPPFDSSTQTDLMNLLTAHIAVLNTNLLNGAPASTIVGRITNATQGSVSVAAQLDVPAGSAQWYQQTRYGAEYWTKCARFRTALYFPGCGAYGAGLPVSNVAGWPVGLFGPPGSPFSTGSGGGTVF
jgi:Protein of unknown function (DUF4054)